MRDPSNHDSCATRNTLFLRLQPESPAREIAWQEFHDRYAPMIAGFARKMGLHEQDLSDLIQDVLLGFFAASPKFCYDPSRGRFRSYLKTCTWHAAQSRFNESIRLDGRSLTSIDAGEVSVEQAWNDVWEAEKLQSALDLVRRQYLSHPDQTKTFQAFEMSVLGQKSSDEIARALGITHDSVYQAKSRITKAIRSALKEIEGDA